MRRSPLHDASCKIHIGAGRILLALLLTSVLFRQSDVRADSLPVFVSASVTGFTLKVTFSGVVTCPLGCAGFTLRVAGTSNTVPIIGFGAPSGSTISNMLLNAPGPPPGQALVLDYDERFVADASGNPIASFTNQPVANLTTKLRSIGHRSEICSPLVGFLECSAPFDDRC